MLSLWTGKAKNDYRLAVRNPFLQHVISVKCLISEVTKNSNILNTTFTKGWKFTKEKARR